MIRFAQRAFTLIEVMVALAVFGVMSALAYATLGTTLTNADILADRMDRLQAVQRAVRYLTSDLLQAAPRPIRGELGQTLSPALQTSLSAEFALELTHGGWSNPAGLPRGTLQRTAYRLEDDELVRYHWRVLDRTFANEPVATVLLDDVDALLFRYLQANGEWTEVWPPQNTAGGNASINRPQAVEVVLTLRDQGEIRRVLEIAP